MDELELRKELGEAKFEALKNRVLDLKAQNLGIEEIKKHLGPEFQLDSARGPIVISTVVDPPPPEH